MVWKLIKAFIKYEGGEDIRFSREIFIEAITTGILRMVKLNRY